ncbi:MAG: DUF2306 domain-containing protein [Chitinophagaceae bacterium]|nr:DUF2306 domain-containing protein [Chitinophagaceae bacterium]
MKKTLFILLAALAILVSFYPLIYFINGKDFGLLQSKNESILSSRLWSIGFYTHITFGGIALLTGWSQFVAKIRTKRVKLHRLLGKIYVLAVLLSSVSAMYIAFYATGGLIPSVGFGLLGIVWFTSTVRAFLHIRNGQVDAHQKMMIYSYAACLAAVTLRIYLPLLTSAFQDFIKAYTLVAWLCWVPNIVVAYFLVKQLEKKNALAGEVK